MYAKLFSRIAQSSLMEQDVEVRYCFMMLLAIADIEGDVIGTDVAIARQINLDIAIFQRSIEKLMLPDPDSNSPAQEGRRIVKSENGRGYNLVNYCTYRAIKTVEEKRAYMRDYMRERRKPKSINDVTSVNICKNPLSDVTHAEAEAEAEAENKKKQKNPKPAASSYEDFISELKSSPAYTGIDIDRQLSLMDVWLKTPKGKGRRKTHQFILNWLSRVDQSFPILDELPTMKPIPRGI